MVSKFKRFIASDRLFSIALVILVGLLAYGLGREAGYQNAQSTLLAEPAIVFTQASETELPADAIPVVASRGGTKYHRLDCPGVATIKKANLIRFASVDLARAAGYEPAKNCPELQ